MSKLAVFMGFMTLAGFMVSPALALETPWAVSDQVRARLLTGVDSIGEAPQFEALLDIDLAEGWHTYWHHPGDAGLPPRFDWAASENIENVEVGWPAPVRKKELDLYTFGYDGLVEFPLIVKMKEPHKPATLNLKLSVMVCKDICIPQNLAATLEIPAGTGATNLQQGLIERAKQLVPKEEVETIKIDTVVVGPEGLVVGVFARNGFSQADIFATAGDYVFTPSPEVAVDESDKRKALIKISRPSDIENLNAFLSGKELNVILKVAHEAAEKKISF